MAWPLEMTNTTDTTTFPANLRPNFAIEIVIRRGITQWQTPRPFEVVGPGVCVLSLDCHFLSWFTESVACESRIDMDEGYFGVEHDVVCEAMVHCSSGALRLCHHGRPLLCTCPLMKPQQWFAFIQGRAWSTDGLTKAYGWNYRLAQKHSCT